MELGNKRSTAVYIILAGIFISSMTMLNILGTSRFVDLSFVFFGIEIPVIVAIGVLPYPITFLCTDLISELYGKKKATLIVWTGLVVNIWLAIVLWLGGIAPEFTTSSESVSTNNAFMTIRSLALGNNYSIYDCIFFSPIYRCFSFSFFKKFNTREVLMD